MDLSLSNLRRLKYSPTNNTTPNLTHLPPTVLDAFIPGYSVVCRVARDVFNIDVSTLVSILFIIFVSTTGLRYLSRKVDLHLSRHLTTSLSLDSCDDRYHHIVAWLARPVSTRKVRSTHDQTACERPSVDADIFQAEDDDVHGATSTFNYLDPLLSLRSQQNTESRWFWHKTHYFKFAHQIQQAARGSMCNVATNQGKLTLTVLARSTRPIQEILDEAREADDLQQPFQTTIYRPTPREQRERACGVWNKVAVRPSRPMATVALDDRLKSRVLDEIHDFLQPSTRSWYSDRGIPFRRGYLFCGPPGTGKTSLSFALAGAFQLDVYSLSLSEASVTEEELIILFDNLPAQCLVLLEDVDGTEGLRKAATGCKGSSLTNQGTSLSGLLNLLDGVASQEGRILVITATDCEELDDRLLRPGRVDLSIELTLANKQQIRELFTRVYCVESKEWATQQLKTVRSLLGYTSIDGKGARAGAKKQGRMNGHVEYPADRASVSAILASPLSSPSATDISRSRPSLTSAIHSEPDRISIELKALASAFADQLPDGVFSPADVQGFLLTRRKDPRKALEEISAWREEEIAKRKERQNNDRNVDQRCRCCSGYGRGGSH